MRSSMPSYGRRARNEGDRAAELADHQPWSSRLPGGAGDQQPLPAVWSRTKSEAARLSERRGASMTCTGTPPNGTIVDPRGAGRPQGCVGRR